MRDNIDPSLRAFVDILEEPVLLCSCRSAPIIRRLIDANAAAVAFFGLPKSDLIGASLDDVLQLVPSEPPHRRIIAAIARGLIFRTSSQLHGSTGERAFEVIGWPLGAQDGLYALRLLAQPLPADEDKCTVGSIRSLNLYRLDVVNDALQFAWASEGFVQLFGHGAAELRAAGGLGAFVVTEDLPAYQRRSQRLLSGREALTELRLLTREGRVCRVLDHCCPIWQGDLMTSAAGAILEAPVPNRASPTQPDEVDVLAQIMAGVGLRLDWHGRILGLIGGVDDPRHRFFSNSLGIPFGSLLPEDGREIWRRRLDEVAPGLPPVTQELELKDAGGRVHLAVAATTDGLLAGIKTVERATFSASQSEALLLGLLDHVDGAVVLMTPELDVVAINRTAQDLTAWKADEIRGQSFPDLFDAPDPFQLRAELNEVASGQSIEARETWLAPESEQRIRIAWRLTPLTNGSTRTVAILAEGTPMASWSENGTLETNGRRPLDDLIDHMGDGVFVIDSKGVVVALSASAEAIFGYGTREIEGVTLDKLISLHPADGLSLPAALSRGGKREVFIRRKDGNLVPVEARSSPVRIAGRSLLMVTIRESAIRQQTEQTIRNLVYSDALTGLPNRLLFDDRLGQAVERARRQSTQLAVLVVDLDQFKLINDALGMEEGNRILREVGRRLVETLRRSDTVAHLGGDDFLILLLDATGAEALARVAQKLLDRIQAPLRVGAHDLTLGASIGIAMYPDDGETPAALIVSADAALFRTKQEGRGTYQFHTTDMKEAAVRRLVLESALRRAIERNEFVLHFQPQISLEEGRIVGAEALVRWRHEELGLIPPSEFIPLAEQSGLILPLGRWVMEESFRLIRRVHDQGFSHLRLAVNIAAKEMDDADLVGAIVGALKATSIDPALLEIEITESNIMRDLDTSAAKLDALARLGIRIAIDDFGTGYSSLSRLSRLPIRAIKIDRTFVQEIGIRPGGELMTAAIIRLGQGLGLSVIAEGVETEQQLDILREQGCDEMQGYHFSPPLPFDELLELLRAGYGERR